MQQEQADSEKGTLVIMLTTCGVTLGCTCMMASVAVSHYSLCPTDHFLQFIYFLSETKSGIVSVRMKLNLFVSRIIHFKHLNNP